MGRHLHRARPSHGHRSRRPCRVRAHAHSGADDRGPRPGQGPGPDLRTTAEAHAIPEAGSPRPACRRCKRPGDSPQLQRQRQHDFPSSLVSDGCEGLSGRAVVLSPPWGMMRVCALPCPCPCPARSFADAPVLSRTRTPMASEVGRCSPAPHEGERQTNGRPRNETPHPIHHQPARQKRRSGRARPQL